MGAGGVSLLSVRLFNIRPGGFLYLNHTDQYGRKTGGCEGPRRSRWRM